MAFRNTLAALALMAASPALAGSYTQTNLVSDGATNAAFTDPNLKNPWGISDSPTGDFWVSDNATGLSTLYSTNGSIVPLVVTIPAAAGGTGPGSPTGQVFYPGSGFVITEGGNSGPSVFIFATEDGTISGWNPNVDGTHAIVAVDRSGQHAVYKGLALYTDAADNVFLLATDFHNNEIDVFDSTFKLVSSITKSGLEKGYAPYNVADFGGKLFVTYAKQDKAKHDSVSGPGLGAVQEIDIHGKVRESFAHGKLNAPWGMAIAPKGFGPLTGHLLVGNFGDGRITGFTPRLKQGGTLRDASHKPIAIDGLWGLIAGNGGSGGNAADIYFAAGPHKEADGLFGAPPPPPPQPSLIPARDHPPRLRRRTDRGTAAPAPLRPRALRQRHSRRRPGAGLYRTRPDPDPGRARHQKPGPLVKIGGA